MLLSKDDIFKVDDRPSKIVSVPEWGGDIKLRAFSTSDRIKFEKESAEMKSEAETIALMVLYSCVDDDNKQLFSKEDMAMLQEKSISSLLLLFREAAELNTLGVSKIEDRAKNS